MFEKENLFGYLQGKKFEKKQNFGYTKKAINKIKFKIFHNEKEKKIIEGGKS